MNFSDSVVEQAYFARIDYSILIVTLICSIAIGIYFGFFSKSLETAEDYLVGGHKMKVLPIAISLVSSQISALAIMTIPAEIYSFGWQYALSIPAAVFVVFVTNYISLPVFYHNKVDNCYVYLEMRFGRTTRRILTVLYVLVSLFQLPVVMYIASLAYAEATKQDIQIVNIVLCYICVMYTMLGGIKAVVWTDVFQAIVMIVAVALVAFIGIHKTGGIEEVWNRAVDGNRIFPPNFSGDLTTRVTVWNTILSSFLVTTCGVSFNQSCAQRLVSLPSLKKAKRSMVLFAIVGLLVIGFNCATGIIMYSFYHGCDPLKAHIVSKPDGLMPRFVQDVAGHIPGMSGIFISCVVSASLSTLSAGLHALSGVVYSDYVLPLKLFAHTDANANLSMRVLIFLFGSICAFGGIIFEQFRSIFEVTNIIYATTIGAKFGVFTIGMVYPWANQKGVLSGILIGSAVVLAMIVNSQYHKHHYDVIPTSIEQCSNETLVNIPISALIPNKNEGDDGFAFYKISFQWYSTIGVATTWIASVILSHLTGGQDLSNFNMQLLSPFVQKWLSPKHHQTELRQVEKRKHLNKQNDINTKSELSELIS